MKKKQVSLCILLVLSCYNIAYPQTNSFFDDVEAMRLSFCFKNYIIDTNTDLGGLPGGMTSHKAFLNSDSSLMLVIHLSNRPRMVVNSTPFDLNIFKEKIRDSNFKKNKLLIKRFHAQSGFATSVLEQPSQHFDGYVEVWGAMLFSKSGMFTVQIYNKESLRKKMSGKTLVKLASSFIKFNN